jgi:hypothetical protein
MPERIGAALLHWVNPVDVRPLYYAASVTTPAGVDAFAATAQTARAKAIPTVALDGIAGVQPLPAALAPREQEIRASEQFRTAYEPFGSTFASVPIRDLVTPQWWVDTAYVAEFEADLPAAGDEGALFDYCFAEGKLEPPMMLGSNAAVIVSGRRSLGTLSPLRLKLAGASMATFEFDARPRPNYLWLNVIPATQQIAVLNGVHHLTALLNAGRDRAYCLIRQGPLEQVFDFGPNNPGIFKAEQFTADRPPLVRDYLDNAVADTAGVRASDQFMRFAVAGPEIGTVPQSE